MQARAATTVSQVTESAGSLTAAIQSGLRGAGIPSLTAGVQRLMTAYRSGQVPDAPVMTSRADAAAYAAYRMPATAAATALAVQQMCRSLPGWAPVSLLDFGAGTGGASWAVADELASIGSITLLEQSAEAISLGRAILARSGSAALRAATWCSWQLPPGPDETGGAGRGLPGSDLAVSAYVLGELTGQQQERLVGLAATTAPAVLLVEPGTPAGHQRILAARALLLESGFAVVAPCPHEMSCPLQAAGDWCHFGARLQRSAVHRQVKGAELSYEDEKFSYVAAIRPGLRTPELPAGRIVRRPQQRKGLVLLDLCASDGTSKRELVSKSKGELYKAARKASWGDRYDGTDGSS
jgi:ribosomal protein RSM22 (predicted rRNA methylase)